MLPSRDAIDQLSLAGRGAAGPTATTSSATQLQAAAAAQTWTAHSKGRFVDPLFITITSMSTNVGWSGSKSISSLSGYNVGYYFWGDKWSYSGNPPLVVQYNNASRNYAWSDAYGYFRNTDFRQILLAAAAPYGPGAVAAVYAACGFTNSPAVFEHWQEVVVHHGGGFETYHGESKTGACVGLTHYSDDSGAGYSN